jgi:hypothetical protein
MQLNGRAKAALKGHKNSDPKQFNFDNNLCYFLLVARKIIVHQASNDSILLLLMVVVVLRIAVLKGGKARKQ